MSRIERLQCRSAQFQPTVSDRSVWGWFGVCVCGSSERLLRYLLCMQAGHAGEQWRLHAPLRSCGRSAQIHLLQQRGGASYAVDDEEYVADIDRDVAADIRVELQIAHR